MSGEKVYLGEGRWWVANGSHSYGWLLGVDGKTYGYPLTLDEAWEWLSTDWPPTLSAVA